MLFLPFLSGNPLPCIFETTEMQPIVLVQSETKMHNETLDVWCESKTNGH